VDKYNTRIRAILDEAYPDILDEDAVQKVIEYCREDDMLDPDKWINTISFEGDDPDQHRDWFDIVVPHLYGILTERIVVDEAEKLKERNRKRHEKRINKVKEANARRIAKEARRQAKIARRRSGG